MTQRGVAHDAGKEAPVSQSGLADGQIHREDGPVLAPTTDLTTRCLPQNLAVVDRSLSRRYAETPVSVTPVTPRE
jgi:hypothetical protein